RPACAALPLIHLEVLDPDDGNPLAPRALHQGADIPDDRVARMRLRNDADLHVNDEECGVRPILECGHIPPSLLGLSFLAYARAGREAERLEVGAAVGFARRTSLRPRYI